MKIALLWDKTPCRQGKGKCKFNSEIGHKVPKGESLYKSIIPLISALDAVGGQRHVPSALPRERPVTYCVGGWVGLVAGLDGCGKSRVHRDSIPTTPSTE